VAQIAFALSRNFPLSVVLLHGILAVTTLVLVLFTAIGSVPR
jgi:hypothetical protein